MSMSDPVSNRLRAALARKYDVERELGAGGMGTVYLARDTTLERSVAVKILRPELATATAAERFLREARILANLNHPNVVPVHSAGEEDGLFYYVMEYVQGETLAERLTRGPLSEEAAVRMSCDLLDALETAHEHGIIHRDVKPGNVFLVGDRVLLGDFGLAKPVDDDSPPLTEPGQGIGTPAYMPPEQASGSSTNRTDLYAVGMIVYEALTGRRWSIAATSEEVDWSGVPRRLVPVLRKALSWKPDDRWGSAAEFRAALGSGWLAGARPRPLWRYGPVAAAGLAIVAILYFSLRPVVALDAADLAILPFSVRGLPSQSFDDTSAAFIVRDQLELLPDVRIVPTTVSFPWYSAAEAAGIETVQQAASELNARYAVDATIIVEEDGAEIELRVFDATGATHPESGEIRLEAVSLGSVSDSITRRLQTILLGGVHPEVRRLTRDPDALTSYANGEKAFERGDWPRAREHYERAIQYDSTFIQAWWHLATAYRWLGYYGPYPVDYGRLFERYSSNLGTSDSLLMAAQLEPAGPARLAAYRDAVDRYPQDDFATFLLGEELFNRGALWGESLEDATTVLEEAVRIRSSWSSSYVLLVWAYIRLGRAEDALRVLEAMPAVSANLEEGWQASSDLLWLAYETRFMPEQATSNLQALMADTVFSSPEWLAPISRLVGSFDIPNTQVRLGSLLSQLAVQSLFRAGGFEAAALGHLMLGQTDLALAAFDSAAALFDSPESRLQAAEWRVLPPALGIPMTSDEEMHWAREELEALLGDSTVARRAAWALAMDAYAQGDTARGGSWARLMQATSDSRTDDGLDGLLVAMDADVRGRPRDALAESEALLELQAMTSQLEGGPEPPGRLGDSFARAALHLKRGEWFTRLGDGTAAEREWRWYQAVDIVGFPVTEPAQAGEVDWALGTFGRYLRGRSAFDRGEYSLACPLLARVSELWSQASPRLSSHLSSAVAQAELACNDLQR